MTENIGKLDEQFIDAWHGNKPLMTIADDLNVEPKVIEAAWRRLKREERLPKRERPWLRREAEGNADGRPSTAALGKGKDPLFAALWAHYGKAGRET